MRWLLDSHGGGVEMVVNGGELHLTAQCEVALSAWFRHGPWHPTYDPRE